MFKRGVRFLKSKGVKNYIIMTITLLAVMGFFFGIAAADSDGTTACILVTVCGAWCGLFYYANNEWVEK